MHQIACTTSTKGLLFFRYAYDTVVFSWDTSNDRGSITIYRKFQEVLENRLDEHRALVMDANSTHYWHWLLLVINHP